MHGPYLPRPIPYQGGLQVSLVLLMAYMGIPCISLQLLSAVPVIEIPQRHYFLFTARAMWSRHSLVVVVPVAPPSTDTDGMVAYAIRDADAD